IPDYLAVVGDSSDGYPGLTGWGAKSAAAILTRYGHLEDVPARSSAWEVPGVGGSRAMGLAATLRDQWDEALLYRDLARLRTVDDGVPLRQTDPEELRWDGVPRDEWEAFCEEWGLPRLAKRPHRWRET
ncbi:MAG: flap endonuclease, partial [Chloroflexi bacterium]|nr:flap endonuclease [Chloroflexota bacterium]